MATGPGQPALTVQDLDPQSAELADWLGVVRLSFKDYAGPVGEDEAASRRAAYGGSLVSCARDGESVVGTIRSFPTGLTVPGGQVPAWAVTAVTVLATHRRRGAMSAMLRRHLRAATEDGAAVAVLIASEARIYGRFGFGPCTESAEWTLDLRTARVRDDAPRGGTVRIVPPADLRPLAPALYRDSRTCGDIDRPDPSWWDPRLGVTRVPHVTDDTVVTVLASGSDGTPQGYLRYSAKAEWADRASRTEVTVHDLRATTRQAWADLWGYLAELDTVATVRAPERAVDEPLPLLLTDLRSARQTGRCDFLWSRVLDPVAALGGRAYEQDGEVTLRVLDPGGPADGTFRLTVHDGRAECSRLPAGAGAEVTLPVDVLGAVWLGGGDLRGHHRAGRIPDGGPGATDRLARLLHTTAAPWSATWF
jgi:predicted acetyltransferase